MKKIGILTFWGVPNYGAWMQAYALSNVIKEINCLDDVKHIAYLDSHHYMTYYRNDEHLLNAFMYSWSLIPHTEEMNVESLEKEAFDAIVTGSDSIWEFTSDSTNNDIHLIGNNLNSNNIIAYAASAGTSATDNISKDFVCDGLKKYKHISVRDFATCRMIKDVLGIDVPIVADPSLLYDFYNDPNIKNPVFEKYIFVYGVVWDDDYIANLKLFAKSKNLKLISCGYINDWCDISFKLIELRTYEWLGFVKNSSFVATSMFHGLMLGLSMGKQVFFYQHDYVRDRSEQLLNILDIPFYNKKNMDNTELDSMFNYDWNEQHIRNKLEEVKKRSKNILKIMICDI